jgi:hypothetical protein
MGESVARFLSDGAIAVEARLLWQVRDLNAGDESNGARGRPFEPGDDLENGRLSSAVRPDERDMLALVDLKRNAAKYLVADVGLGKTANAQQRRRRHGKSFSSKSISKHARLTFGRQRSINNSA